MVSRGIRIYLMVSLESIRIYNFSKLILVVLKLHTKDVTKNPGIWINLAQPDACSQRKNNDMIAMINGSHKGHCLQSTVSDAMRHLYLQLI